MKLVKGRPKFNVKVKVENEFRMESLVLKNRDIFPPPFVDTTEAFDYFFLHFHNVDSS
jgi:hypothetical protein